MALRGYLKQSTAVTIAVGPFVDATDGVTAETALTLSQADWRLSKNGGAFAQANEATSASHMENGYYSKPLSTTDTNTLGILTVHVNESGALPVTHTYAVVSSNVYDSLFGTDKLQTAGVITSGTAQSGTASTIVLAASTSYADDIPNGAVVYIKSGTGAGQSRVITDYAGATDTVSVEPNWTTNPDNTSVYEVFASPPSTTSTVPAVDVVKIAGATVSTTTAQLGVNVVQISGDATAADNAELMFDGTGYAGGTTKLGVDVVAISGDTTAADNAELMFDGTGYAGGTIKLGVDAVQISSDTTTADNLQTAFASTLAESAGAPAANANLWTTIKFLGAYFRNKMTFNKDTGAWALRNDADSGNIATRTDSNDGTTYTRGEVA